LTVQSIEDLVIDLAGKKPKKHHKHAKADKEHKGKGGDDTRLKADKKPEQSILEESVISGDKGMSL
jgi:hypothetical protein